MGFTCFNHDIVMLIFNSTLSNPNISQEAKDNAEQKLSEMGAQ